MNYEGLEGTRFNLVHPDGEVRVAVIAGCDPDVGYTIQDAATGRYIICSHGPSSVRFRGGYMLRLREYKADFEVVMGQIAEWGLYTAEMEDRIIAEVYGGHVGSNPSAETCAFAQ